MSDIPLRRDFPVGSVGRHANGWWGMTTLIATEGALFAYLLFSYFYLAVQHGTDWLPTELPKFRLSAPDTIILIVSSLVVWRGEILLERGRTLATALSLAGGALLGALFVVIQYFEWSDKKFSMSTSAYGSLYFTITGFHMAHVIVGVVILAVLAVWTGMRYFDRDRSAYVSIGAMYWHFVDMVWLAIFFSIYITPYLGIG